MLIDTHAHLYWESFQNDFDAVIQKSFDSGVTTVINVGVDVEKSQKAAQMENGKLKLYSTVGIHPQEASKYIVNPKILIAQDIQKLEDIYYNNLQKVIGVGECGLDFCFSSDPNWDFEKKVVKNFGPGSPYITSEELKHLQISLFKAQIDLAKRLELPLIIHCRDDRSKVPENIECWEMVLEMIRGSKGILHCYSGFEDITKRALILNFLFSFAATISYPNNRYLRDAVKMLPLEKIALETDSPFLPLQNNRGQRNDPSAVLEIAKQIAEIKQISSEKVASQTTANVKNLFKLS